MGNYLTTAQAADILNIERASVQKCAQRGEFPGAVQIGEGHGARWLIPLADVEAYQARRRSPGRPRPSQEANDAV